MAINKNHEFEELDGVKCAIVERNAKAERAVFLKDILNFNGYTVVIVNSPPPKAAPAAGAEPAVAEAAYTIGVTDLMFNPVNAIFGRLLRTSEGEVVTLDYWRQA